MQASRRECLTAIPRSALQLEHHQVSKVRLSDLRRQPQETVHRGVTSKAIFSPSRSQSSHSTSHWQLRASSFRLRSKGFLSCSFVQLNLVQPLESYTFPRIEAHDACLRAAARNKEGVLTAATLLTTCAVYNARGSQDRQDLCSAVKSSSMR